MSLPTLAHAHHRVSSNYERGRTWTKSVLGGLSAAFWACELVGWAFTGAFELTMRCGTTLNLVQVSPHQVEHLWLTELRDVELAKVQGSTQLMAAGGQQCVAGLERHGSLGGHLAGAAQGRLAPYEQSRREAGAAGGHCGHACPANDEGS